MAMMTSATLISEATSGSKGALAGTGSEAVAGRWTEGNDGIWGKSPEAPVAAMYVLWEEDVCIFDPWIPNASGVHLLKLQERRISF